MKAVTEFPSFLLSRGLAEKNSLTAGGKTAEEISAQIGQSFKYEGDKLKHFLAAIDISAEAKDLKRVMVISLAEGEAVPAKAIKVEEHYYVPEALTVTVTPKADGNSKGRGGKGGRGGKNSAPKGSPWGLSPEEKAQKNKSAGAKS